LGNDGRNNEAASFVPVHCQLERKPPLEKNQSRISAKVFITVMTLMILLVMMVGQTASHTTERYRYRQSTENDVFDYTWEKESQNPVKIQIIEPVDQFVTFCDTAGQTLEWKFLNAKTRITAKRNKNTIHVSGTFQNQVYNKIIPIGDEEWYQALSYSLRQMALSGKAIETFWMIRMDNLAPIQLKAVRMEPEAISVFGQTVMTHKLKITLTGLLQNLWSAHYWFRSSDGVFLQYKGTNGPPGTPETLIQLLD